MNHAIKLRDIDNQTPDSRGNAQEINLLNNTLTLKDKGGQLVQMDLGQADVHIDKSLASYCAGFRLQEGVADIGSPILVVPNASDKYWTWDKDDTFQLVQDIATSAGGAVKEVSMRLSNTNFQTRAYALQAFVPTEVQTNADAPINPNIAAMRRIMNAMMLAREVRVATMLRTQANHTNVTVLTGTTKWNGGAGSNPIQDILSLVETSMQPITDIIMGQAAAHAFMQNAAVQKYIAYKQNVPGLVNARPGDGGGLSQFSAALGLPPIHIGAMKYKTSATAYPYVWGGDIILVHRLQGVPTDGQDIAASYTFRWNGGSVGDSSAQGGFVVRSFFNPYRGPRGGTQIVLAVNDIEVMTSTIVSGLIVGAVQ